MIFVQQQEFLSALQVWKKEFTDYVISEFRANNEHRGEFAFSRWKERFISFLTENAPKEALRFRSKTNHIAWSVKKGEPPLDKFMRQDGKRCIEFIEDLVKAVQNDQVLISAENKPPKPHSSVQTARIFVSYSSKDRERVTKLVEVLNTEYIVWYDQELANTSGQDWWSNILAEIRTCDVVLLMLTPQWLESEPCLQEYNYAHALYKRIMPVKLDNVDFGKLPLELQKLQVADYQEESPRQALDLSVSLRKLPPGQPMPDPLPPEPQLSITTLTTMPGVDGQGTTDKSAAKAVKVDYIGVFEKKVWQVEMAIEKAINLKTTWIFGDSTIQVHISGNSDRVSAVLKHMPNILVSSLSFFWNSNISASKHSLVTFNGWNKTNESEILEKSWAIGGNVSKRMIAKEIVEAYLTVHTTVFTDTPTKLEILQSATIRKFRP
jgi:hypothetical protein